jgi:D-serine deaminase-like pyridoxal phosphate-dependent protein
MTGRRPRRLQDLETPCAVLDQARMQRNIERLQRRLRELDVAFRPHLKTAKSAEIARRMMPTPAGPATVSTLREAEQFASAGVRDILYAVGIAPAKLDRVLALRRAGVDLSIILDSLEQAHAVAVKAREADDAIPVLIEIDSDGHRAGVRPHDPLLVAIGDVLQSGGAVLRGVMTHAGGSYDHPGVEAITLAAEQERLAVVTAAETLRQAKLPCPVISVGSTPTAHFARHLDGVTEVRAGVFVFMDLVMAGLGVCTLDGIAFSVLGTVIGHQRDKGWIITDAGWMALSRDRGTANHPVDQGYGLVCDRHGRPYGDLVVAQATQEHGILELRSGSKAALPELPLGTLVRILPNHACATAAQHDRYHVIDADGDVSAEWSRFGGW